jgi:hypothetical protein
MDVDDPGSDELAGSVDFMGARRNRDFGAADRLNDAVGKDNRSTVDPPALAVEDCCVTDHRHRTGIALA